MGQQQRTGAWIDYWEIAPRDEKSRANRPQLLQPQYLSILQDFQAGIFKTAKIRNDLAAVFRF